MGISLKPIDQQVMVITGASSGIGLATAEAAAEKGAKLVLAARSENTLKDIVANLNNRGIEAIAVTCDVADRPQVERLAAAAISRFGRIDTWVNNAGLGMIQPTAVDTPFPQHTRNFTDQEPKLPTPQIEPGQTHGTGGREPK